MRLLLCLLTGMLFMLAGCSAMKHRHDAWHAGRDHTRTLDHATVMLTRGTAEPRQTLAKEQRATQRQADVHRCLKWYCVTRDIVVMHFVTGAIEEKLGRKARPKKGTA